MRAIFPAIILNLFLGFSREVVADVLAATDPIIDNNGRLVGYKTDDPNIHYLIPMHWQLNDNKAYLTETGNGFELYFVLTPAYSELSPTIVELKLENQNLLLFPLPYHLISSEINFLEFIGETVSEISPAEDSHQGLALYYKILLDDNGLSAIRNLAAGGAPLTGGVKYKYDTVNLHNETIAPIIVNLTEQHLQVSELVDHFDLSWVKRQVFSHELALVGVLDGGYDMGEITIAIESSVLTGNIIENNSQVVRTSKGLLINALNINFPCRIIFFIPILDQEIDVTIQFKLDIELDLKDLSVHILNLKSQKIEINGGDIGSFFEDVISQLLSQADVRASVSDELTEGFRKRIINQDLFI